MANVSQAGLWGHLTGRKLTALNCGDGSKLWFVGLVTVELYSSVL